MQNKLDTVTMTEGRISNVEDKIMEKDEAEEKRDKTRENQRLSDSMKCKNIRNIRRRERESGRRFT